MPVDSPTYWSGGSSSAASTAARARSSRTQEILNAWTPPVPVPQLPRPLFTYVVVCTRCPLWPLFEALIWLLASALAIVGVYYCFCVLIQGSIHETTNHNMYKTYDDITDCYFNIQIFEKLINYFTIFTIE